MTEIRHPDIEVRLIGEDGNAFAILGNANRAMRRAGLPAEERAAFQAEATKGDYDHLLATVMNWFTVK